MTAWIADIQGLGMVGGVAVPVVSVRTVENGARSSWSTTSKTNQARWPSGSQSRRSGGKQERANGGRRAGSGRPWRLPVRAVPPESDRWPRLSALRTIRP
jgi:hypothetical protein